MSGAHLSFRERERVALEVDYAVVGSGAGGASAGAVLARAGYSVALVEAGPWLDPADYPESVFGAMRDLWSEWGSSFARGDSFIPILQASAVGGGTTINSAILVRTPSDVLSDWARLGLGQVFSEQAMEASAEALEGDLFAERTAGVALGPSHAKMVAALSARGMDGHPTLRAARACLGTAQCLQGCKSERKQSANVTLVPEMLRLGASVLSCARVARVAIERGRAVGVVGRFVHPRTRARGARFRVSARRGVLVAASATGSAPLLAKSGVRLPWLGRGWRGHPGGAVIGLYPGEPSMVPGATQGAASLHLRASLGIKLESLTLPLEVLAARLSGAGRALMEGLEQAPHMALWVAAVRAQAEGSVEPSAFGGARVRYQPTRADAERLRSGCAELARLHFEAGATRVLPGIHGAPESIGPDEVARIEAAPLDNKAYTWVLTHLFGGCIMGNDPARSVVAPDLCVRGVRALHVVDASALPTTLGVNPQLTIMAVARVVALRLCEEKNP